MLTHPILHLPSLALNGTHPSSYSDVAISRTCLDFPSDNPSEQAGALRSAFEYRFRSLEIAIYFYLDGCTNLFSHATIWLEAGGTYLWSQKLLFCNLYVVFSTCLFRCMCLCAYLYVPIYVHVPGVPVCMTEDYMNVKLGGCFIGSIVHSLF